MAYDHDDIANRLAKKSGSRHRRKGVDIVSKGRAIEVAVTQGDMYASVGQLKRSRARKKYMAVPAPMIPDARRLLKGSGIGIMNTRGRIRKRSRKK